MTGFDDQGFGLAPQAQAPQAGFGGQQAPQAPQAAPSGLGTAAPQPQQAPQAPQQGFGGQQPQQAPQAPQQGFGGQQPQQPQAPQQSQAQAPQQGFDPNQQAPSNFGGQNLGGGQQQQQQQAPREVITSEGASGFGSLGGSSHPIKEEANSLLLFRLHHVTPNDKTKYGPKDSLSCDYIVLSGQNAGMVFRNQKVFSGFIIQDGKRNLENKFNLMAGFLGLGVAQGGGNAPWRLFDEGEVYNNQAIPPFMNYARAVAIQNGWVDGNVAEIAQAAAAEAAAYGVQFQA